MSQRALSGESRKQMFIDAMLKVQDEAGAVGEFLERGVNFVKAFSAMIETSFNENLARYRLLKMKSYVDRTTTEVYAPTCGDGELLSVFAPEVKI